MYNGHEYLSCIKIPATKQATTKNNRTESMDLAADYRDLIIAANKVFGEGKWSHTVVSQTLDFVEIIGAKCCAGCVSFVKVQLENGNFHEDVGYYSAEESTKGLSVHNARIGSAVNALRRVLLSFGDKIERELQQLQRQVSPERVSSNDVQRSVVQSDKQIPEKSNVSVKISAPRVPQAENTSEPKSKNSDLLITDPTLVSTVNNGSTETNPSINVQTTKSMEPSPKKTISSIEQKLKQTLSISEAQRLERKRKQMEKQMEFKRRMMEKEKSIDDNNKPNPRY